MILPLASLTKIMTANTVHALLPENSLVTIKKDFLKEDSDIQLIDNEQWTVKNLLDYTLTISSNDGAVALAAAAGSFKNQSSADVGRTEFITEMNTQAQEIGLTNSTFYNESGLDQDMIQAGAYGTARDMTTLFNYTLKHNPEILEATRYATVTVNSYDNLTHVASNTNSILSKIPNILGSKTGFTQLAGGNLVIAYDTSINRPIIAVILGSTYDGRFDDMLALVDATNQYISLQNDQ
jgi:D-alanyl-D-alanine carboxypeptidase (penicillin-binding protein 5/6)